MKTKTKPKSPAKQNAGSLQRVVRTLALLVAICIFTYLNTHTESLALRFITGSGLGLCGYALTTIKWKRPNDPSSATAD